MPSRIRSPRFVLTLLAASVLLTGASATTATADAVYHTQRIPLLPVGNLPLRSGFVVNIHADGPRVYALERYVLVGAAPDTTYQVTANLNSDTSCQSLLAALPTARFTTNAAGDGEGHAVVPPSGVPPFLHGATIGGFWTLSTDAGIAYRTDCTTVTLD